MCGVHNSLNRFLPLEYNPFCPGPLEEEIDVSPIVALVGSLAVYFLAYRFYARRISKYVFQLDDSIPTPAHVFEDGHDYVPAKKHVLFGHHYASIAGLAPMLGPAIAVMWGWLPAMIWVVLGTVFIGVTSLTSLVLAIVAVTN